jgi:hypothetical protein
MRNLAMSSNASFDTVALRWSKSDLPITLRWRSTLWRFIVPPLWALGWAFWIWVLSVETGESTGLYALLFVSIPLLLAASAAWWVGQLLHKRHAGTIVINDDYGLDGRDAGRVRAIRTARQAQSRCADRMGDEQRRSCRRKRLGPPGPEVDQGRLHALCARLGP